MTVVHLAGILLGFMLVMLLVRKLAWLAVRWLVGAMQHLPTRLGPLLAQARDHPLNARSPRLHAALLARLSAGSFTGLPLTVVAATALGLLALLAVVVREVLEAEGIIAFDKGINAFFSPYRDKALLHVFLWVTDLGAGAAITVAAVTATGFLWIARQSRLILSLWITLLGVEATTWAMKHLVGRERPEFLDIASATSPSFPSGHTTASMAVYGFLAYALARHRRSLRTRFEIVYWASVLIILIGFSRMFLSVHFLSDVFSGLVLGGFWLLVGIAVAESARGPAPSPP